MRRKSLAQREPSGKLKRNAMQEMPSAAEVQRLRTAALAGMRDAVWGSTLGWMYLNGKISAAQFAAGRRWRDLARNYASAMQSPQQPSTAKLERSASTSVDPETEEGRREARRHAQMIADYRGALTLLQHAGRVRLQAVMLVCEQNVLPVGADGADNLASGLQTLVAFWGSGGRKRR